MSGTAGKPVNIIERNLCRRSANSTMQVQGEAIVRNNVLIGGQGAKNMMPRPLPKRPSPMRMRSISSKLISPVFREQDRSVGL